MKKIAIFASGKGSNAEKIIEYFRYSHAVSIVLIVSNKPDAGVFAIAATNHLPTLLLEKEKFFQGNGYVDELKASEIDFIVLAGFLWKVPASLIYAYPQKIINIHPALLPKYGGKGYYGRHIHEAVLNNKDEETGISIHLVDEIYDHGKIIFSAICPILENDNPDSLAKRVQKLEHAHYSSVIEKLLNGKAIL